MPDKKPENVYDKIASVTGELAKTGIAKSRRNQQQGYQFRGIDEVYAALSPLLAKHRLNILPRVLHREVTERTTQRGGALFNVTVEAEFDFVSADDGTSHTVRTFGEAMDSADKATNKAMSAAYKYAAFMTFAIPTEGDNDADATTHEVVSRGSGTGTTQEDCEVSPTAPISDADWSKIVSLCQATNTKGEEVKAHIEAANLKLLSAEQLEAAFSYLNDKLAKMAKAETDAKAPSLADALGDEIRF